MDGFSMWMSAGIGAIAGGGCALVAIVVLFALHAPDWTYWTTFAGFPVGAIVGAFLESRSMW